MLKQGGNDTFMTIIAKEILLITLLQLLHLIFFVLVFLTGNYKHAGKCSLTTVQPHFSKTFKL